MLCAEPKQPAPASVPLGDRAQAPHDFQSVGHVLRVGEGTIDKGGFGLRFGEPAERNHCAHPDIVERMFEGVRKTRDVIGLMPEIGLDTTERTPRHLPVDLAEAVQAEREAIGDLDHRTFSARR
jgi:hypothetical protein